jgi:hypothetical protein
MGSSGKTKKVQESNKNGHRSKKPNSKSIEESTFDHGRTPAFLLKAFREDRVNRANTELMHKEAKELRDLYKENEREKARLYSLANSVDQTFLQSEQNLVKLMIMRVEWEREIAESKAERLQLEIEKERVQLDSARVASKEKALDELKQQILEKGLNSTITGERAEKESRVPESKEFVSTTAARVREPKVWRTGKTSIRSITHRSLFWACMAANVFFSIYLIVRVY